MAGIFGSGVFVKSKTPILGGQYRELRRNQVAGNTAQTYKRGGIMNSIYVKTGSPKGSGGSGKATKKKNTGNATTKSNASGRTSTILTSGSGVKSRLNIKKKVLGGSKETLGGK